MKWHELNGPEIKALAGRDPVAILPVAAIEQHGPHLPLSTDVNIGEGLVEAAVTQLETIPLVVLPTQAVGVSSEHVTFPGTLTLSPQSLEDALVGLASRLHAAGLRRLVLSNSHGGNKAAIDSAALRIRCDFNMLAVKAHYFRFPRPEGVGLPDTEWIHGLHGGAIETAMMMHLKPNLVRTDELQCFSSLGEELERTLAWIRPEGVAPFAWTSYDLNPQGVSGDATLATAELGSRLVEHYAGVLAEVVRDAHAFPIGHLERRQTEV